MPPQPAKIDAAPVEFTLPCETPDELVPGNTAEDLVSWTLGWVAAWKCEAVARKGLLKAWPK